MATPSTSSGELGGPKRRAAPVSATAGRASAPSHGSVSVPLSAAASANVVATTECVDFNSDADADPSDPVDVAASAPGSGSDSALTDAEASG